jgi:putative protease
VRAENFTFPDIRKAVRLADRLGKQVYLAVNAILFDENFRTMRRFLKRLNSIGIRTLILSDMGLFAFVRDEFPAFKIHISTQASVANSKAVEFYARNGASRVILARELTLAQIREIRKQNPQVELETFVHGAMCIAWSGRCLMSDYFTGRSANRGDCAHACRWEYSLVEAKRPDEILPVEQDRHGTYIMSSKDLNMVEHIPELCQAGITAFKIEGRMKSLYYVAVTTMVYRMAIDHWHSGKPLSPSVIDELEHVSHRPYHTGFYFGKPMQTTGKGRGYIREYLFLGMLEKRNKEGLTRILLKNPFGVEDKVEAFQPDGSIEALGKFRLFVFNPETNTMEERDRVRIQDLCFLSTGKAYPKHTILRMRNKDHAQSESDQ